MEFKKDYLLTPDEVKMTNEHDGCNGCAYNDYKENEWPCRFCRGTVILSSPEYKKRPDLWVAVESESNAVNHPKHYTSGSVECIDAMRAAFGADELATYCKIAAFKYIWRCDLKGGIEDIKKARFYLEKYIELKDGGEQ